VVRATDAEQVGTSGNFRFVFVRYPARIPTGTLNVLDLTESGLGQETEHGNELSGSVVS
jgi:hypothetical protein